MNEPSDLPMDFTPGADPLSPVDLNVLSGMLGEQEVVEVLRLFVESSEELLSKINTAIANNDRNAMKEAVHTLKGACSSIGANEMWQHCIEFEKAVRTAKEDDLSDMFAELMHSYEQAKAYIEDKI